MPMLESSRLLLRDTAADDLPALLPVYLSNPDFVSSHEGSRGEAGYFDLDMLQRDWHVAAIMPSRHMLGLYLKASGEPVGMVDYLEEDPSDGMPWLGLLLIAGPRQRRGLGTEAFNRLAAYFHDDLRWTAVRLAVGENNPYALAFWRHLGFQEVERAAGHGSSQPTIMERQL